MIGKTLTMKGITTALMLYNECKITRNRVIKWWTIYIVRKQCTFPFLGPMTAEAARGWSPRSRSVSWRRIRNWSWRRLPNAARLNGIVPMLIVNDAPSTPTGLLEILAKSFAEDSGSRAQVRNSCMIGSKRGKARAKTARKYCKSILIPDWKMEKRL